MFVEAFQVFRCPSWRGLRLIRGLVTVKWLKEGRNQKKVSILKRCLSYRGVRLIKVSVKGGLTVNTYMPVGSCKKNVTTCNTCTIINLPLY